MSGGKRYIGPPKSAAGRRTVAIPPHLWPVIDEHLATYVGPTADALVFTKASGVSLDRANRGRPLVWLGFDWPTIANALGVTRQAARQRHHRRHTTDATTDSLSE